MVMSRNSGASFSESFSKETCGIGGYIGASWLGNYEIRVCYIDFSRGISDCLPVSYGLHTAQNRFLSSARML